MLCTVHTGKSNFVQDKRAMLDSRAEKDCTNLLDRGANYIAGPCLKSELCRIAVLDRRSMLDIRATLESMKVLDSRRVLDTKAVPDTKAMLGSRVLQDRTGLYTQCTIKCFCTSQNGFLS